MAKIDNIKVLEAGFKKARELAAEKLFNSGMPIASEVVDEASSYKSWTGFTGNAQTSYGTSMLTFDGLYGEYDSNEGARPVIRNKLELDESVFLWYPYEGKPRRISGKVDIDWPYSDDALRHFLNAVRVSAGQLACTRFAFPVEYADYLSLYNEEVHRSETPLEIMHQLASLALKDIR